MKKNKEFKKALKKAVEEELMGLNQMIHDWVNEERSEVDVTCPADKYIRLLGYQDLATEICNYIGNKVND